VISLLGGVSHFRFKKLLSNSKNKNDAQFITHKMKYFQDLNLLLSINLFIFSVCFIILSADGLTAKKTINLNKFMSDFFICNSKCQSIQFIPWLMMIFLLVNITCIIIWAIVILIFHPKKTAEEKGIVMTTSESIESLVEIQERSHK
jgi:ABC-type phosphate/phosphonate transport system permease subunit